MHHIRHIEGPPGNLDEFINEMASGLGELYGAQAEAEYRATASGQIRPTFGHANVGSIAIFDGPRAIALLIAVVEGDVGRLSMIHVLNGFEGRGLEGSLLKESVSSLRAGGVQSILSEIIPFCELQLDEVYESLGFTCVQRALMQANVSTASKACDETYEGGCLGENQSQAAAEVIISSYKNHPDQLLHAEVTTVRECMKYIERVRSGAYGPTLQDYLRTLRLDGRICGVLLACKTSPRVGFILQISVEPDFQGQGIGTKLIADVRRQFKLNGLEKVALGVSLNNPALKLYNRLGFSISRSVNVYLWRHFAHTRPVGNGE